MARPPRNLSKEFKAKEAALTEKILKAPESQKASLYEEWKLLQQNRLLPNPPEKSLLPLKSVTEPTLLQRQQREEARKAHLGALARPWVPLAPNRGRSKAIVPGPPREAPRPLLRAGEKAKLEEAAKQEQYRLAEQERIKQLAQTQLEEMRPEDWEEDFS